MPVSDEEHGGVRTRGEKSAEELSLRVLVESRTDLVEHPLATSFVGRTQHFLPCQREQFLHQPHHSPCRFSQSERIKTFANELPVFRLGIFHQHIVVHDMP